MFEWIHRRTKNRQQSIFVCGLVGILINIAIATVKILFGLLSHTVAITADGVNNFFDATSAVVASISAKVSAKEADAEHPYGHGRVEYIAALIIAFVIVTVGFELLKTSISSFFDDERSAFGLFEAVMMTLAVLVKVWIIKYNKDVDRRYDSSVCRAVAQDARNDVYSGLIILLCLTLDYAFGHSFEAVGGVLLSAYIMQSGYRIAKDMIGILLGTSPGGELQDRMESILKSDKRIFHVHNWRMHDYGTDRIFCSVNVCMRGDETLLEAHDLIDALESRILEETGVVVSIHIDPYESEDKISGAHGE